MPARVASTSGAFAVVTFASATLVPRTPAAVATAGGAVVEVGRAVVVLRPSTHCTAPELIAWCRAEMANYKVPREVLFVDSLPVNAAGKVTKFQLKAWQAEEHS